MRIDSRSERSNGSSHPSPLWLAAAGVAATSPIVVALVRALDRGWYPVGDNAYFSLRARDVLTEHHPLLGTWTSASLSVGRDMNNPGPLLWDLLAVPAKISPVAGIAVATAVMNILSVVGMAIVARRCGGSSRSLGVLAAATALSWTMGSELLFDPWQPHALLFPFLLYLVLVWSLVDGDIAVLPLAVGVGSVLVQTHLTYAVLVAGLGALGMGALAVSAWRIRSGSDWSRHRRVLFRTAMIAVAVIAVCWAQPVVEQVTERDGNLGRLAENAGGGGDPRIGVRAAVRLSADIVAVPPAWARPSFAEPFTQERNLVNGGVDLFDIPAGVTSVVSLGALGVLLAGGTWLARRRRGPGGVAGSLVAGVALLLALVTAAAIPVGSGGLGTHQIRWLWPIGIFTSLIVVLVVMGTGRAATRGLLCTAVVLGAAALPTRQQPLGPAGEAEAMPVMLAMAEQLDGVDVDGPVLFSSADLRKMSLYEPYSTPMMLEMARRGIGFVVDDSSQARQVGESRLHPEGATVRMVLLEGDRALERPPGARRIGFVAGLDRRGRAELARRLSAVQTLLRTERLELTDRGRELAARGLLPGVNSDGTAVVGRATGAWGLLVAVEDDLLEPSTPALEEIRQYAALQRRWDAGTLAAYLVPLDEPAAGIG